MHSKPRQSYFTVTIIILSLLYFAAHAIYDFNIRDNYDQLEPRGTNPLLTLRT